MSHETNNTPFRISITPMYPPLASCQLYRVDVTYNKIYQGYVDFCYSKKENEFKGVRQRVEGKQEGKQEGNNWKQVDDWYPTLTDYLYSIREHVFDIRYGKEEYSMESLRSAMEQVWNVFIMERKNSDQ